MRLHYFKQKFPITDNIRLQLYNPKEYIIGYSTNCEEGNITHHEIDLIPLAEILSGKKRLKYCGDPIITYKGLLKFQMS